MDMRNIVDAMGAAAPSAPVRFRQGVIVSVAANYTVTVTIGGSTTQVSGIKVASTVCPVPGATCWLATDGKDWMVWATLAPAGPAWGTMRKSTQQSIPNAAWTEFAWGSRTDVTTVGVTAGSNGFTVTVPGIYQIEAIADFAANATGQRHCAVWLNGSSILQGTGGNAASGSDTTRLTASGTVKLAINDIINIAVYQSSTAALNTATANPGYNILSLLWLGASV